MPKKDSSDSYIVSELGNWNVAAEFSEEMVMNPLRRCNIYEDIARFGYHSLLDQLENLDALHLDVLKISGLSRMINELVKICRNNKFAMKRKKTKETLTRLETKLIDIKAKLPLCYEVTHDKINKVDITEIRKEIFNLLLEKTCKLREEIHDPLNKNNLIFVDKEQIDLPTLKKATFEEATTLG